MFHMLRASHQDDRSGSRVLMPAVASVLALATAVLAGAWWMAGGKEADAPENWWLWLGLGLMVVVGSAWLTWVGNVYRRRWALARMQTHRLVDVLDICYWQTDAAGRLTLWRPPREAPESQWDASTLVGRPLWEVWLVQAPHSAASCESRMRAGATLIDIGVRRADGEHTSWLLRGVPRFDLFGRHAGYEGTLRLLDAMSSIPAERDPSAPPPAMAPERDTWAVAALALESASGPALLIEMSGSAGEPVTWACNDDARRLLGEIPGAGAKGGALPPPTALWRGQDGWPVAALDAAWHDGWDELRLRMRARDVQPGVLLEVSRCVSALKLDWFAMPTETRLARAGTAGTSSSGWAVLRLHIGSAEARGMALEDQEALMYAVSHDLRAPLRVVEGFTRIVKEDYGRLLDRVGNDHLDRVLAASLRMNGMIDAVLEQAKLSTRPLARETVNLSQIAAWIAEDLRRQSPQRQVEIVIEDGMQAAGDPLLLRMALENLIGNAWKYSAKRPRSRIEFSRQPQAGRPGLMAYCVRDNGVGFDMRYAGRLFGMFQRLHSANDYQGTGVGLASVRRIVHRHGGRIWAESEVDVGTRIYFTLGESDSA